MAAESNNSNELKLLKQKKMAVPPNLKPKTTLGQKTIYLGPNGSNDSKEEIQYRGLKTPYYLNPCSLQPLLNKVKSRIITNRQIKQKAQSGIYTWILKRNNVHITPLRSNQEIGSLHANIDVLTVTQENMGNNRIKPEAAGEMLIINENGHIEIFFNLQSGTFSEPIFSCRAKEMGESRGMNKKELRKHMDSLKMECRDDIIQNAHTKIIKAIDIPSDKLHFLECNDMIDARLKELIPANFDHSPCKDADGYFETLAGKNLIRRVTCHTPLENREIFNTYFTTEKPESKPNLKRKSNKISGPPVNNPPVNNSNKPSASKKPLTVNGVKTLGGRQNITRRKRRI
jgi:hypothetical protein